MTPKRAREKGIQFERLVAAALSPVFPKVKRRLEFQQLEQRGVDLDNTGRYLFQCKKLAKYAPINLIKEIDLRACKDKIPVLVTSGTGQEPMAVLPLSSLVELLKAEKICEAMLE